MKDVEELATVKEIALQKKLRTIGNYVHDSVPVSNNEVSDLSLRPVDLEAKKLFPG